MSAGFGSPCASKAILALAPFEAKSVEIAALSSALYTARSMPLTCASHHLATDALTVSAGPNPLFTGFPIEILVI